MDLWLDDERDPQSPNIQQGFRARGNETWVKTAEEAIELLKTGKVTSISLDHDLGTMKTGYDVAKFIEEGAYHKTLPRMRVYVHSQNPEGSRLIKMALRSAIIYWNKVN